MEQHSACPPSVHPEDHESPEDATIASPSAARTSAVLPRRYRVSNEDLKRSLNLLVSDTCVLNEKLDALATIIIKGTVSSAQMSLFPLLEYDFSPALSIWSDDVEPPSSPLPIVGNPSRQSLAPLLSAASLSDRDREAILMQSGNVLTQELPSLISHESVLDSGADIVTPSPSTPSVLPPPVLGKRTSRIFADPPAVEKRPRYMRPLEQDVVEVVDLCTPSPCQEE